MNSNNCRTPILLLLTIIIPATQLHAISWPNLSIPAKAVRAGKDDAAIIVSIEKYAFVSHIPGAISNGISWYDYFHKTRGIPVNKILFLKNSDATAENIREAASSGAKFVGKQGTLWFVFIGHGSVDETGKDALLVGVDAQQKIKNIGQRSLKNSELLSILSQTNAKQIAVLLDACFSGRGFDGKYLVDGLQPLVMTQIPNPNDARVMIMTAAKGNEFAGPLPGTKHPAFSYLVLGALRGWADQNEDMKVTAAEVDSFVNEIMAVSLYDRIQTPEFIGNGAILLGESPGEKGPDLGDIIKSDASGRTPQFEINALSELPPIQMPAQPGSPSIRAQVPVDIEERPLGVDFSKVDIDTLEEYDAMQAFDKSDAAPTDKAKKWRAFGERHKTYSDISRKRGSEWEKYANELLIAKAIENDSNPDISPKEKAVTWREVSKKVKTYEKEAADRARSWDKYAVELAAYEKAERAKREMCERDFAKLNRLLKLSVVKDEDKQRWVGAFLEAYGIADNPYLPELYFYIPQNYFTNKTSLKKMIGNNGVIEKPNDLFYIGSERENIEMDTKIRIIPQGFPTTLELDRIGDIEGYFDRFERREDASAPNGMGYRCSISLRLKTTDKIATYDIGKISLIRVGWKEEQ